MNQTHRVVYVNGAMWHIHDTLRNQERRLANRMFATTQGTQLWARGFKLRFQVVGF